MAIVGWVLMGLGIYALIGAAFALWFVVGGVGRISPAARGTGWAFRAIIVPGSAALWPVLVWELVASRGQGGLIVGRAVRPDDLETAMESDVFDEPTRVERPEIDPDAETHA